MKKILLSFTLSSVLLYANTLSDGQKQFKNKQYEKSFKTFFQVAKDGMVAKYNIASMYELGLGVEKNLSSAISFYKMSANDGYALAQNALGNAYLKGIGVKKDLKVAINYYKLAAKQNNKNAIKSLDVINKLLAKKKKENMQKESMEVGYLTVRSNVNNDKVYLNGKFVGKTKLILPLSSNTAHSIEIRKAGYKTYKFQPVRVQTKEKKTIRAYLERL